MERKDRFNGPVAWSLILLVCLLTACTLVLAHSNRAKARLAADDLDRLAEFAEELGTELAEDAVLGGLMLKGTHEERDVTLQLGDCEPGRQYLVQFGVRVDPSVSLRIEPSSLLGKLKRALGGGYEERGPLLVAGSGADGADVFVHGGPELIELLDELNARWFRWFFNRMVKVARFYERRPIRVTAKSSAPDGFAWTGGGEESRCPYCRDALPEALDELVACEECQTLHHAECFQEHGGCTIYGCQGSRAPRVGA